MEDEIEPILSEDTAKALLRGYSEANPGKIIEASKFDKILKWAEEAEISRALLMGIVEGEILPSVDDDGEVVFSVSEKGIKKAESMLGSSKQIKVPGSERIQ